MNSIKPIIKQVLRDGREYETRITMFDARKQRLITNLLDIVCDLSKRDILTETERIKRIKQKNEYNSTKNKNNYHGQ